MIQVVRVGAQSHNGKEKLKTNRIYYLEGIGVRDAKILAEKLFCENIIQKYTINHPLVNGSKNVVEIAYKPGVMNPEVESIIKAARDLGIKLVAADSATEYHFPNSIPKKDLEREVHKLRLFNKIVEHIVSEKPRTLLVPGVVGPTTIIPLACMTDEELLALSKDKLYLNLEEMKVIQNYYRHIARDPIDCELETLAQTWSEHCAHKTFKAKLVVDGKKKSPLIARLRRESARHKKLTVSSYVDNSGVMEFYDGMAICGKVETHNSPSAIEPYGGAATGSGGVFRDILGTGLGAHNIASTDIFCFAPVHLPKNELPPGCLAPDYLLKRIVKGVQDYGNRMGIPTNNGSVHFHKDFRAKPTVIVGAYGLIPTKKAQKGNPRVGDLVIAVGGRTGRDGIHGATFSSAEMTDKTVSINSSAVQIGNAIEEKRMFDAILEARDKNLIHAIQDCGAGGFSSAIGEMGEEVGVRIDLARAPLKYQGLAPWEIWVSESQERMVLAIPKEKLKELMTVCRKYNVEASNLGEFDGSGKLQVYYGKKQVCNLEMDFLHHGLLQRKMVAQKSNTKSKNEKLPKKPKASEHWNEAFLKVLSHGNIASKEPIVRLYDHTVQGTNALQPYQGETLEGPSDAAVVRPILGKPYGMIISHGLNPVLNNIDPYMGSIWAGVEALSNYVAVGGNYREASLVNNYIWPFPDNESLWSLDKSVDAVVDLMKTFRTPVISGKDSLSSTYRNQDMVIKIPPVLCISVFGRIPDVSKTISADLKSVGSSIYLVGKLSHELGGSVYYDTQGVIGSAVPKIDIKKLPKIFDTIYKGIQKDIIFACHDISEGGLLTAAFEMCVGGAVGMDITIPKTEFSDSFLFGETAGCFLIEIANDNEAKKLFKGIPYHKIANTQEAQVIRVEQAKKLLFEANIQKLKKAWQKPMKEAFV